MNFFSKKKKLDHDPSSIMGLMATASMSEVLTTNRVKVSSNTIQS
jgi:hypothetical protein